MDYLLLLVNLDYILLTLTTLETHKSYQVMVILLCNIVSWKISFMLLEFQVNYDETRVKYGTVHI